jgi:hypothetical protein
MRSPPHYRQYEDAISGIVLIAFAAFILWIARNYPIGTLSNMGPGWFPRAMCYIIISLGVILVAANLRTRLEVTEETDRLRLRPLLFVTASIISFGLTLGVIGLLPAVLILIAIAGLAISGRSALEWVLAVIGLEAMTLGMYYIVRLPVPLFGTP